MTALDPAHLQRSAQVRCEWGPAATALAADLGRDDLAVVVDVLSFSTTVTVAVEAGMQVWPSRWRDERAAELAARHDAVLAVGRLEAGVPGAPRQAVSLSPSELGTVHGVERVVLPSPNGSSISVGLLDAGAEVVAGCLRNAAAVAALAAAVVERGGRVLVVPCGERWPDGSLRPAIEDWWGAGAVLAGVADDALSPEARAATAAFAAVSDRLETELSACASGRELVAKGYRDDVVAAARLSVAGTVGRLVDSRFVAG